MSKNAEYWYNLGYENYNLRQTELDKDEDSPNVEKYGVLAARNFFIALSLGHIKASYTLYACFGQGIGVEEDAEIASLMYAVAAQLGDERCNSNKCQFPISTFSKSQAPYIVALIQHTKNTLPINSNFEKAKINEQFKLFDKTIKLPNGKSFYGLALDLMVKGDQEISNAQEADKVYKEFYSFSPQFLKQQAEENKLLEKATSEMNKQVNSTSSYSTYSDNSYTQEQKMKLVGQGSPAPKEGCEIS